MLAHRFAAALKGDISIKLARGHFQKVATFDFVWLAWMTWTRYASTMSSISVDDLKKKPASQWLKYASKSDLVITSQGRPVAVLLPTDAQSLKTTLSMLRSVRALQAQTALQKDASENGTDELTMAEIDAEIASARRSRRGK
jgi:antitoxin (DNA-binding transcriptional repressor) of toxin-antitoxin stability system